MDEGKFFRSILLMLLSFSTVFDDSMFVQFFYLFFFLLADVIYICKLANPSHSIALQWIVDFSDNKSINYLSSSWITLLLLLFCSLLLFHKCLLGIYNICKTFGEESQFICFTKRSIVMGDHVHRLLVDWLGCILRHGL